jgi:hypothetical protein
MRSSCRSVVRARTVVALVTLFLLLVSTSFAQKDAGTIAGTVKDVSGAVVAQAKVTVTDVDRGTQFSTTTNTSGGYVASPLHVGRYRVEVEQPGFKKAESSIIDVSVQQRAVMDFTLQIGGGVEHVEVTAVAPLLERETSELGQVVERRQVANLPLNGRNFAQLALLTTGTAPSEPGSRDEGGFGFSANGARSLQNNFLLDGVDNNSNLPDLLNETNFVIQPSVEALQEFKVQTNAYSAEFGRGNGAIINAVIKSGTNQFHGSAWEFLRNEKFDARNYFDTSRQPYKQNQFGVTFGGPIQKKKIFFFMDYEGLRIRQAEPQTAIVPDLAQRNGDFSSLIDYTTPVIDSSTNAPVLDCNGRATYAGEIFNSRLAQVVPVSNNVPTGVCGMPFGYDAGGLPLNIIPGNLIDPLGSALTKLFPNPNAINPGFNFLADPKQVTSRNNFDVRVDYNLRQADTFFARFSYQDQPSIIPSPFDSTGGDGGGFFTGNEDNSYKSAALSETHIFTPHLVNEFRFGYNRIHSERLQFNADKAPADIIPGGVDFPGIPFVTGNGGLPQLTFSDISTLGSPTFLPSREIQNTFTGSDNLTYVHNKHSFKFGTEIRWEEFTILQPAESRGTLDFGSGFTGNPGVLTSDQSGAFGGSGYASFLLGISDGGGITNLHNIDYRRPTYAFFAQDDWRLTSKLTLNLGLRYELFTTVKEKHNQQGTYDLNTQTLYVPKGQNVSLTPTIASYIPLSATATPGLISPDKNNFAPRIGLAYAATNKFVVRAGYGIFYGGTENGPYSNPSPGFNPPYFTSQSFSNPCGLGSTNPAAGQIDCSIPGLAFLQNGFPASSLTDPNTPILFSLDPKLVTPYMQQWHLSTQYQLPWDTLFEVTYAGSKGSKLFTFFNGNQATPTDDPTIPLAPRRPIPAVDTAIQWFRSSGKSSYNSLQLRAEKRFTSGLYFLTAYTWAHSLDIASNANLGAQNGGDFRDFRFPNAEYGNSDFDIRQRLVVSYLYELPFGHGKHFAGDAHGAKQAVIGGWQVGGITSASTGSWFTITDNIGFSNSDNGGNVGSSQRPDVIANPFVAGPVMSNPDPSCQTTISQGGSAADKVHTFDSWFNPCAFTNAALGTFGNVGRNTIQGPGSQIWDFTIFKHFMLSERARLEFRSEFFNVWNHTNPQFAKSGPQNSNNATVRDAPGFAALTAARSPRQIQFALKLSF